MVKSHELIFIRLYLVPLLPYFEVFFALKWIRNLGEVASQREAAWKTQWVWYLFSVGEFTFSYFCNLWGFFWETFLDFFSNIEYFIDIIFLLDSCNHFLILKPPVFSRSLFVYTIWFDWEIKMQIHITIQFSNKRISLSLSEKTRTE